MPSNLSFLKVPCGKCFICKQNKSKEWSIRLNKEISMSSVSFFVTLTYNDDCVPFTKNGNKTLNKRDIQLFNKRLRITLQREYNIKYRFFICGEYGPRTMRPHYHGLFFFEEPISEKIFCSLVEKAWSNGFVVVKKADSHASNYCSKYVSMFVQLDVHDKEQQPTFALMSRRPGIGYAFTQNEQVQSYFNDNLARTITINGKFCSLPRYFKEKIYSEEVRNIIKEENYKYIDEFDKRLVGIAASHLSFEEKENRIRNLYHEHKMFYDRDAYENYKNRCLTILKLKGKL